MISKIQKTFTIDTVDFQRKLLTAVKDGYLEGRVEIIPNVVWFVVYPNKTHVTIQMEGQSWEGGKNE